MLQNAEKYLGLSSGKHYRNNSRIVKITGLKTRVIGHEYYSKGLLVC